MMHWIERFGNLRKIEFGTLLRPGLRLKRWIIVLLLAIAVTGAGAAVLIGGVLRSVGLEPVLALVTLRSLPWWARGVVIGLIGVGVALVALVRIHRQLLALAPQGEQAGHVAVVNTILQRRPQSQPQGPRIVAIGGGTGMPQLLRGLRAYTDQITAVVTVADDGGSSGRLRRQMGTLPPGDFRNNIAALSDAEDLMTRLMQYRFAAPQVGGGELAGHSFGNLFIATMAAVTGTFERGLTESSRVLAVRGRILPSTLENITLWAEVARPTEGGDEEWLQIQGESNIPAAGGRVLRVFLRPDAPPAYPAVIRAILEADLIVAGPGSFFTSVIPNLLVPGVYAAICASPAVRIYVCNVASQPGETDGYHVDDYVRQLQLHAPDAFPNALANHRYDPTTPPYEIGHWVQLPHPETALPYRLFTGDLVQDARPWHHDSRKLAQRIMEVFAALRAETAAADTAGSTPVQ
ncbi:MAG: YvcK family protein [Caldilineaceae bacterium]|nr:YvcK family protein [Caldilineaceae bacterium]